MKTLVIFSMIVFTFLSCKKKADEDHVHPEYANANAVMGSNTLINVSNWIVESDDGINFEYYSDYTYPAITQDVVDKGAVLVYIRWEPSDPWTALPYSESYDTYSSYNLNYEFSIGSLKINLIGYDDSGSPGVSGLDDLDMRVVVLNSTYRIAGVDWNDYESVEKALGANE